METGAVGGVSVGWFYATWPFATLHATRNLLSLSCGFFGSWEFSPEEVVRFEAESTFFGGSVTIVHAREDYPDDIVFSTFGPPDSLIRRIVATGFRPQPGSEQFAAAARIEARGGPVRWSFIIGAIAAWNGLLLLDWHAHGFERYKGIGPPSFLAMALVVLVSFGVTRSSRLQDLVLKPGRSVSEILPTVRLAQFLSAAMVVVVPLAYLFR